MSTPQGWTQRDSDSIADVIWWIKGYQVGCFQENGSSDLHAGHIEALAKARRELTPDAKTVGISEVF